MQNAELIEWKIENGKLKQTDKLEFERQAFLFRTHFMRMVQSRSAAGRSQINWNFKSTIWRFLWPSPDGEGADAPTVWGKCHEVTKGDGSVRPPNGGGRGEKTFKNRQIKGFLLRIIYPSPSVRWAPFPVQGRPKRNPLLTDNPQFIGLINSAFCTLHFALILHSAFF